WRSLEKYKQQIATPARNIQDDPQSFCDIAEFAEVQALTGGTTTFSGTFLLRTFTTFPTCLSRLAVRKLEIDSGFYPTHGHERVQNLLGVGKDYNENTATAVRQKVAAKQLDLVLIHVAEGKRTDPVSIKEFDLLKQHGFLAPTTAVIHGVAFDKSDFAKMRATATALVWSPQSNMILYNTTTDVVAAFREGVSLALAPDWAPSGAENMLGEIQYAAKLNKTTLGGVFSNQQLFEMATSIPARIAHIDDKVGTIQQG